MHKGREFSSTAQGNSAQERGLAQVRPLRLAHVSSDWARWHTVIFGAGLQFPVDVGGRVWMWEPVWPSAWRHPAPARWACTLHGSVGGQPFTCWLDSAAPLAVPPLREEDLSPLCEAPLPQALLAAVVQDVTSVSLAHLGAVVGQQVILHSMHCTPGDALPLEEGLPFTLTLADAVGMAQGMSTTVKGLLAATWPHPLFSALYQAAQNKFDWQGAVWPHWPLPCAVVWRTRPLAVADIRALEAGDVLLMPCMTGGDAGTLPVQVQVGLSEETGQSQSFFAARWCVAQRTVTLETSMQQDMTEYEVNAATDYDEAEDAAVVTNVTDAQEDSPSPASSTAPVPPATWDQCRVPIQCRLGEVSVTLAELSTLAPGAVLHALDSVEAPVSLWLGATRIGRGALVDVDGRIGVRITEIIAAARRG